MNETRKRATLAFAAFLCLISVVYGLYRAYEWWSLPIPVTEPITGNVEWSGIPEVGENITITVEIDNPTGSPVNGHLLVEVYQSDKTTLVAKIWEGDVTVPPGEWSQNFTWTPEAAGDYYAKATFTEAD